MADRDDATFRQSPLRPRPSPTLRSMAAAAAFLAAAFIPASASFAAPQETGRAPGRGDTCTSNCWSSGLPNVALFVAPQVEGLGPIYIANSNDVDLTHGCDGDGVFPYGDPSQGGVYAIVQQCPLSVENPQGTVKWTTDFGGEVVEITGGFNEHDTDQPQTSCSVSNGMDCTVVRVEQSPGTAYSLSLENLTEVTQYAQYVFILSLGRVPPAPSNLSFADVFIHPLGGQPQDSIAIADVNGDGNPDIATVVNQGVAVLPGDGAGDFGAVATAPIPPDRWVTSVAPVVIDGESDVAYTWFQNFPQTGGDQNVSGVDFVRHPNTGPAAGCNATFVRQGDLDFDGQADDLAIVNEGTGTCNPSIMVALQGATHRAPVTLVGSRSSRAQCPH